MVQKPTHTVVSARIRSQHAPFASVVSPDSIQSDACLADLKTDAWQSRFIDRLLHEC